MGGVWWVLLFAVIAVGGLCVLALVARRLWRSTRALLDELDVMAVRAGELADLLSRVGVVGTPDNSTRTLGDHDSELTADDGWPGTVESYDDQGATAPGKKDS